MTAAPASDRRSVRSAIRDRGQGSGSLERIDRLAVDPDDDDLVVGRRAGEQRIGRAALEAPEHLGREPDPGDTGDDDGEQENRHQPSNQHPCDSRRDLRAGSPARRHGRSVRYARLEPSRNTAVTVGRTAPRLTATVHVGCEPRAETAPTDEARTRRPGPRPMTTCEPGNQVQRARPRARSRRRAARCCRGHTCARVTVTAGPKVAVTAVPSLVHRRVARFDRSRSTRHPTRGVDSRCARTAVSRTAVPPS